MGMVSSLYEQIGGETVILGKPEIDIYIESTKCIKLNQTHTNDTNVVLKSGAVPNVFPL